MKSQWLNLYLIIGSSFLPKTENYKHMK